MGTRSTQGFTIIETMLVLAITGVLVATLLIGVGGSVNTQRYKDSVNTLQASIQDLFNQVDNVTNVNDRTEKWTCGPTGVTSEATTGTGYAPGQSDCVILGQYMTIVNDTITSATVVGNSSVTADNDQTTDIASIVKNYSLGIIPTSTEKTTLEWGASIAWPTGGIDAKNDTTRSIAILVLRSPGSGTSYLFTSDSVKDDFTTTNADDLKAMMQVGNSIPGQAQRMLCVDGGGGTSGTTSEKLSISIDAGASTTSGIELRSDTLNSTMGQASRCN